MQTLHLFLFEMWQMNGNNPVESTKTSYKWYKNGNNPVESAELSYLKRKREETRA
ncbi:hypothetical protein NSQ29_06025 [Paenibacillus sp. FSL F4-0236]|uniref:hypothetical protein n=1 Tax=Paenibacillus sp. FSL F4-0236 TaxID=2954731 RepID=UPI0030F4D912